MKILTLIIPLAVALSFNVSAQEAHVEDFDMGVAKHKKHAAKSVKRLIVKHMLENGAITQAEIDAKKENRKAVREELRQLKQSGDKEALKARVKSLKQEKRAQQEAMKEYVANNEELSVAIREHRKKIRERKKERRDEKFLQELERLTETEGS